MSLRATHKKLLSAFFITLYAFIVTPTQWWHHHDTNTQQTSLSTSIGKEANSVQKTTGFNCKICALLDSTNLDISANEYWYGATDNTMIAPGESTPKNLAKASFKLF